MNTRSVIGIGILLFGLSLLLGFPLLKVFIALGIIWFGIRIMTGKHDPCTYEFVGDASEDMFKRVLICSAIHTQLTSQSFEGAEVTLICAGGEIDLSKVKTKQTEVDLNLVAICGGLKVRLPKTWAIKSEGVGIIGGYNNQTKPPASPAVTARIKGAAIVGGVDIVN